MSVFLPSKWDIMDLPNADKYVESCRTVFRTSRVVSIVSDLQNIVKKWKKPV